MNIPSTKTESQRAGERIQGIMRYEEKICYIRLICCELNPTPKHHRKEKQIYSAKKQGVKKSLLRMKLERIKGKLNLS